MSELERIKAEMQALHYQLLMDEVSDDYRDDFDKIVKRRYEFFDQIFKIKGLVVLSDNQKLPEVEEDNPFIRLDEQAKMLKSNWRKVIE